MNAEKKKAELKTNEFNKEIEVKAGKKYRVKIDKGTTVDFDDKEKYDFGQKVEIDARVVESNDANKEKIEKINDQPKVKIKVALDKTTWGRCLRIVEVDKQEVEKPKEKSEVSVKWNMFIWPTWTMIIGGTIIGLAITGGLIWALLKKDSDEE